MSEIIYTVVVEAGIPRIFGIPADRKATRFEILPCREFAYRSHIPLTTPTTEKEAWRKFLAAKTRELEMAETMTLHLRQLLARAEAEAMK